MTDEQWEELGRRAVASKGWRWMAGMAWTIPLGARGYWPSRLHSGRYPIPDGLAPIPDLRDPATLGCVLALVRDAWGDDSELWGGRVEVHQDHRTVFTAVIAYHEGVSLARRALARSGRNEAAALVAALEAAPKSGEAR